MQEIKDLGADTCRALDLVDVSVELDALECFCKHVRLLVHGGDFDWSYLPVLDLCSLSRRGAKTRKAQGLPPSSLHGGET
jgi:hypothetical protein